MKNLLTLVSITAACASVSADILPDALPTLLPWGPGQTELTYRVALTGTQQIEPGDEFVILDVSNFNHWAAPAGVPFTLTTEFLTDFGTFGGGLISPPDDPTLLNLRFTFFDPPLVGPTPFTPLSGLIFDDAFDLILRPDNFGAHAHQIDPLGGLPTVNVASIYVPIGLPESSASAGFLLAGLAGLAWLKRR